MITFNLPDLGEGLAEAEIREWFVKEGDDVTVDQPLVAMETAKAVVEVPSPYTGKISKLHGKENDVIQTGAALVTFAVADEQKPVADKGSVVGALQEGGATWVEESVQPAASSSKTTTIKAMPAARVLANEMHIDLALVTATGPGGLITVADVKQHLAKAPATLEPAESYEALHGLRRTMAHAMSQSHAQVVPVTVFETADLSHLPPGVDMTVLVLKAMVAAAKAEPALNAWFDGNALSRRLFSEVNIGLAVDTAEGLIVPTIYDMGSLTDVALRERINHLKQAAQTRSLTKDELQPGTITLSNFGTITGYYATPIIVPPAVAILGCGRSRLVPMVRDEQVVIGRQLPLSLTIDHRAVTGGEATRYLASVIAYLQDFR